MTPGEVQSVAFTQDGRRFASSATDSTIKMFDVELLQEISSIATGDLIRCLVFIGLADVMSLHACFS